MNSDGSNPARAPAKWLYGFVLGQFLCQVALVAPLGQARVLFRLMTFVSSLVMLAIVPTGGRPYPMGPLVVILIFMTGLGFLHPDLNSVFAGMAQIGLTIAVWGPILWSTRVKITPHALHLVFLLLWGFNTLSSCVGVLQVYYPDRFSPDPEFVQKIYGDSAEGLKVDLADGTQVWRPMGLTDSPGGAAASGQFAFLVGLILAIGDRNLLLRIAGGAGAIAGMFCIYLCQVRTTIVLTGLTVVVYIAVCFYCKRVERAGMMIVLGLGAFLMASFLAVNVGGNAITDRFATLTEDRADQVYYSSRGIFLEATFEMLMDYPLGAGLGRWGMVSGYFGDPTNYRSPPLWAEIQPTGWLYDGGLPLLALGYAVMLAICWVSLQIAINTRDATVANWATLVVALNVGTLVNTLTYAVFVSQSGMLCCLMNGVLFAAAVYRRPAVVKARPRVAA